MTEIKKIETEWGRQAESLAKLDIDKGQKVVITVTVVPDEKIRSYEGREVTAIQKHLLDMLENAPRSEVNMDVTGFIREERARMDGCMDGRNARTKDIQ